jgi:hypothetical protein
MAASPRPDWWQRGTAIGSLVSVLLVAVGLYLTNTFNRDQLRLQRDSTSEQQALALKGQRADRFVTAVDQLGQEGTDKLGIRLGGIYALETLMKDSPDDESTVVEVLCAFVRTHAPIPKTIPKRPDSPADTRAAITVLGRRPDPDNHARLDLSNTLLGLSGANLYGADLYGADLTLADLGGADLAGANLARAGLAGAGLGAANLTGANLGAANLTGADLVGANLTGANLAGANLRGAYLVSEQVACSQVDDQTLLPPDVVRPAEGAQDSPKCKNR